MRNNTPDGNGWWEEDSPWSCALKDLNKRSELATKRVADCWLGLVGARGVLYRAALTPVASTLAHDNAAFLREEILGVSEQ